MSLDIAEVARRSGLPASTLRYYEDKGLIHSVGRQGLRRLFSPQVLDQLALIALGQVAGFSLDDIAAMFGPGGEPCIDRTQLSAKAEQIDRTVARLQALSEGLRHAAACPAPRHLDCPSFQRLLQAAAAGVLESLPPLGVPTPRRRAPRRVGTLGDKF